MTGVSEWPSGPGNEATTTPVAVQVEIPAGGPFGAVCRLVAAGVAGRHDLPVDRIDGLQLAIDAALRQPASRDVVWLRIAKGEGELRFHVGPLSREAVDHGGLEHVLSTLVAGTTAHDIGPQTWIDMRIPLPDSERG